MSADPAAHGPVRDSTRQSAPFTDALFRPFLVAFVSVVTIVQLGLGIDRGSVIGLWLFGPVVLLAVVTLLPWRRVPLRAQVVLLTAYAVLAAILLALLPDTAAVVFPFMAAACAGERLNSWSTAVTIAITCAVTCAAAVYLTQLSSFPYHEWPWWLALVVGLTVYAGIARRIRKEATANAQLALAEAERASASEAREAALIERSRIAQEVHDVVGHALAGISLQLDTADALHQAGRDEDANVVVLRARSLAKNGIAETRRAIHALQGDSRPLPEAVKEMADTFSASFETSGDPGTVGEASRQAILRTAGEALTNAHRHAPGSSIAVALGFDPTTIVLRVANGPGAPGERAGERVGDGTTGMGLTGMRERAAALGGALTAEPADGGWLVEMRVPR